MICRKKTGLPTYSSDIGTSSAVGTASMKDSRIGSEKAVWACAIKARKSVLEIPPMGLMSENGKAISIHRVENMGEKRIPADEQSYLVK